MSISRAKGLMVPILFQRLLLFFVLTHSISAGFTIIKLVLTAVITLTIAKYPVGDSL